MDFEALAQVRLREGAGGGEPGAGFCVMELVSWISGDERITDQPDCASPHLTAFAIALNDSAPSGEVRNSMKRLAFLLLASRDARNEERRGDYLRVQCAHVLLASLVEVLGLEAHARRLRRAKGRRQITAAANEAGAALANVARSHASVNARAAALRLGEACAKRSEQALRDCLFCILTAPDDAAFKLALWRKARAILRIAIGLGKHQGKHEANHEHGVQPQGPADAPSAKATSESCAR
jgi:hypothetical protein